MMALGEKGGSKRGGGGWERFIVGDFGVIV